MVLTSFDPSFTMVFDMMKLTTIFCFIFASHAFASISNDSAIKKYVAPAKETAIFLKSDWTGDEDYLFLNIDLNSHLKFPQKYTTTVFKNGLGCQLKTSINKDSDLTFRGKKVTAYELKVDLLNGKDEKTVFCDLIHVIQTTHEENDKTLTSTFTITESTRIKNPSLDLGERPEFITADDDEQYGRIIFKNSFPYSKL